MSAKSNEIVLPLERKRVFEPIPVYVSISPTDVATVLKSRDGKMFLALGKYLESVREGPVVKGQKYRQLTDEEKEIVTKAVRLQSKDAEIRFDVD